MIEATGRPAMDDEIALLSGDHAKLLADGDLQAGVHLGNGVELLEGAVIGRLFAIGYLKGLREAVYGD